MSSFRLCFLLSFITLIWPAWAATCQPRAVSVPFKGARLATNAEARGVLWQIGGPNPQNITLMPSAYYNDTYLWGALWGYCPSVYTSAQCATYRGGLYDRSTSQTEHDVANLIVHTFDDTIGNWTRDDIKLQDGTKLPQYEFALRTNSINSFVHKGELGMAKDSTLLKTLIDSSNISSKSYSFFWGNEVTKEPRDGSLTLGGYDQAIVAEGPNITVPFTDEPKCKEGIIVTLTSLGLKTSGGETRDAWDGLPDLKVCVIATTSNIMTIPAQYWDPIESIMGVERMLSRNGTSDGLFFNTTTIKPASATYSGDLSVTINNALTVTFPNNQLIFDERYIATSGLVQGKTDVKQIPIVRIANGDGMMPRLGGMFFSSAYLMVNHDKNQFTIAAAQQKPAPSKLMAYDTNNDCVAAVEVAAASTTPDGPKDGGPLSNGNPNNSGKISDGSESTPKSGLSGGAIAGVVIGVLLGVALFAGIAFLLWRRKRTTADQPPSELAAFGEAPPPAEKYAYHATEMYADHGHELMAKEPNGYTHELSGSEEGPYEVSATGRSAMASRDGLK